MMKINKIQNTNLNLKVRGQGCADDCTEKKVWVGKLDGNTQGIETEGGGVRLPPSFLKNDGNASIWIKKLLYL